MSERSRAGAGLDLEGERPGGGGVAVGLIEGQPSLVLAARDGRKEGSLGLRIPHLHRLVPTAGEDACWPSGLKATLLTASVCPLRVRTSWPVCASHTFTVLSSLPLTRRLPSGLKATLQTPAGVPLEGEESPGRSARPTPSPSCHQLPLSRGACRRG